MIKNGADVRDRDEESGDEVRLGKRRPPKPAMLPGLGAPRRTASLTDFLLRPQAALDAFPAKGFVINPRAEGLGVAGPSSRATRSTKISAAQARKARKFASDGGRLIKSGRPTEAIALLERSVKLDPGVAAYHHDLGLALWSAGRIQEAIEPFTAAIRLDPRNESAHRLLGHIFDSLGHKTEAMVEFQAAVRLKPDLFAIQTRLGELYLERGFCVESAAAFRAAAAATKDLATAQIAEARALQASGAFEAALAGMRSVAQAHPACAMAHSILGEMLGESGHSREAAAHYDRAAELSPTMAGAWAGVAVHRKFTADDAQLIARMNAALARTDVTPHVRQALHFALGKAHDDLGDYEAAMRNFEAGNRLRAQRAPVDLDRLARHVDRLIQAIPPGYRAHQSDPGVEDTTPVLIVGMPRCGSTLVEQILSSHPEVAAGGELEFWGLRDAPREDLWGLTATTEATQQIASDYLATLRIYGPDAKRVTDKALGNFIRLGLIHRIFPNATFIHCRRNPIDTALSIFTTNFDTHLAFGSDRSNIVFHYRQYQRMMAHWREVLPPDRLIEMDYEALVSDPEPQVRRLISACGLEWNDACLAPHHNPGKIATASVWQARQPIYRTSVERWRRYEPWLGELRQLSADA
jgi:tetratricopeptide (TPR) repeat protein